MKTLETIWLATSVCTAFQENGLQGVDDYTQSIELPEGDAIERAYTDLRDSHAAMFAALENIAGRFRVHPLPQGDELQNIIRCVLHDADTAIKLVKGEA